MKVLLLCCLILFALPAPAASFVARPEVQDFMREMQARHGFTASELEHWFARINPQPAVLKAIAPPSDPRVRSWQAYRARFVEPKRIRAGLAFWQRHAEVLARASAETGVPAEVIVAILGIETFYGRHLGNFNSFAALATLAFDYPPRAALFRRELEALLLLARAEGRAPDHYQGSYAGALGIPQFLPSSQLAYAVDYDGDGRIDLTHSPADAIGSVAHFLKQHGWQPQGMVAVKVGADETAIQPLLAEGIMPRRSAASLAAFGVTLPATAPDAPAALIDLVTPDAPTEYWLGYQNFYVITRYNRSSFYAMAVWQLAEALRARRSQQ